MAPPTEDSSPPETKKRREYDRENGRLFVVGWTHIAALMGGMLGIAGGTFGILSFTASSWVNNQINESPQVIEDRRALRNLDERVRKVEVRQEVAISKIDDIKVILRSSSRSGGS